MAGLVVTSTQIGCAPVKLLDPPEGWLVEWRNRRLYNTPAAYIYASNDAAAGQADWLASRVGKEFKKRTGERPVKALLLVTDLNEEPVLPDHKTYCRLMLTKQALAEGRTLSDAQLNEQYAKICSAMAEQGVDTEMELLMTSVALDRRDLAEYLGFDSTVTDSVDRAAVISTTALIEYANRRNIQNELRKRKIGLVLQVPLAPIIMFEERLRNAKAAVSRDVTLFRCLADQQVGWSAEKRQDETQAYMERKLNEALLPVLTQLTDVLQTVVEQLEPLLPRQKDTGSQNDVSEGESRNGLESD